jgi:type II secretory pathway component PulM
MELIDDFKSRWQGLQTREQHLLRYGAVILGALLFYLFIMDPVYSGRDDAEQRLRAAQEAFSVAQRQAVDLKAASSNPGTLAAGSLLTQVESSAQQQGLRSALKRLQPSGDNQIQVSLEGASYNQLVQWLSKLHQQGVRAQRVDIQRDRNSDLLGAQLLLAR